MSRYTYLAALLAAMMLVSGCSSENDANSQSDTTTPPVGDFNFIAQGTPSTTGIPTSPDSPTSDSQDDNMTKPSQGGDIAISTTTSQVTEQQSPEESKPEAVYISPYKDLDSNVSIQLGEDVYASVPSSILEQTCGLDLFLETYRLAHTLVNKEDYANKSVVSAVYKNGTCLNFTDTSLYLNGMGIGYWCKNLQGTLDLAKSPTISLFNLGTLSCSAGSMTARYSELGEKLDSEDNDLFYKAVYDVKDVEGTPTQARAVLIYNKQTSAISTCLIYLNSEYCADTTANIELLAGSVRFSTAAPDNLVTLL